MSRRGESNYRERTTLTAVTRERSANDNPSYEPMSDVAFTTPTPAASSANFSPRPDGGSASVPQWSSSKSSLLSAPTSENGSRIDPLELALSAGEPLPVTLPASMLGGRSGGGQGGSNTEDYLLNIDPKTLRFRDGGVEDIYIVSRCLTIRMATVTSIGIGVANWAAFLLFRSWEYYSPFVGGLVNTLLALANLLLCERYAYPPSSLPDGGDSEKQGHHRQYEGQFREGEEQLEDAERSRANGHVMKSEGVDDVRPESQRKTRFKRPNFDRAIKTSRHAEIIAVGIVIASGSAYLLSPITDITVCPHLGEGNTVFSCVYKIYGFAPAPLLLPLVAVNIRGHIACCIFVVYNIVVGVLRLAMEGLYQPHGINPLVPWLAWSIVATWSLCAAIAVRANERFHRRSFITRLLLLEKEYNVEVQRRHFNETLRALLPGSAVTKLAAGQVVEDHAEQCTITVCEVKDFNRWSTSLLPDIAMETIDILFSGFDQFLESVKNQTSVRKCIMTGDTYIVAAGLRMQDNKKKSTKDSLHSRRDVYSLDSCRFAGKILSLARIVQRCKLMVGVGIARGLSVGSILGQHYLRYNLSGPAFKDASRFAMNSGPNEVFTNLATIGTISGSTTGLVAKEVNAKENADAMEGSHSSAPGGGTHVLDLTGVYPTEAETMYIISEFPSADPQHVMAPRREEEDPDDASPPGTAIRPNSATLSEAQGTPAGPPLAAEGANVKREEAQHPGGEHSAQQAQQHETVQLLRADYVLDGLKFVSETTESDFWANCTSNANSSIQADCKVDLLTSFMIGLVFFMVPIFEETTASTTHILLASVGLLLAPVRYVLRLRLPTHCQWIPYWLLLLQNTVMLASTVFYGQPHKGMLNQSHRAFLFMGWFLMLFANGSVSWRHSLPMAIIETFLFGVIMLYSAFDGIFDLAIIRQLAPVAVSSTLLLILGVHTREQHRRGFYATARISSRAAQLLEKKMLNHQQLLHSMMPGYVVEQAMDKIQNGGTCVVQRLTDCVVLALRIQTPLPHRGHAPSPGRPSASGSGVGSGLFPSSSSSSFPSSSSQTLVSSGDGPSSGSSQFMTLLALRPATNQQQQDLHEAGQHREDVFAQTLRDHFRAVEQVLYDLRAQEVHCSLIHVVGDTVVVGGPLLNLKTREDNLGTSAVEMAHWKGLGRRLAFERAAMDCGELLVLALGKLRMKFGSHLTGSLAFGNGFAAVLGEFMPSFDLLGSACRSAKEVLNAAPDGFLGCTQQFFDLLASNLKPDQVDDGTPEQRWAVAGFRPPGEATSWMLRGVGQVRVVPLYTSEVLPKSLDAPVPGQIRPAADTSTHQ